MTTRKTYEEAAAEMDALKDTGREMEGLVPVKAYVSPNLGIVYSVRFSGDEYDELRAAADARGVKLSEIIRAGALNEARSDQAATEATKAVKSARKELRAARKALEKTEEQLAKVS